MSIFDFTEERNEVEVERKNRIRLTLAAYAYEFESESIMSDGDFDALAKEIRPDIGTIEAYHTDPTQIARYTALDAFFRKEFSADTGQWIHVHPELDLVALTYKKLRKILLKNNG
jgi:hypothetical protein